MWPRTPPPLLSSLSSSEESLRTGRTRAAFFRSVRRASERDSWCMLGQGTDRSEAPTERGRVSSGHPSVSSLFRQRMERTRSMGRTLCIIANALGDTKAPFPSVAEVQTDIAGRRNGLNGVAPTTRLREEEKVPFSGVSSSRQPRGIACLV